MVSMLESKKDIVYVDLLSAILYPNRVVIKANQNILMRLLINEDTRSLLKYPIRAFILTDLESLICFVRHDVELAKVFLADNERRKEIAQEKSDDYEEPKTEKDTKGKVREKRGKSMNEDPESKAVLMQVMTKAKGVGKVIIIAFMYQCRPLGD